MNIHHKAPSYGPMWWSRDVANLGISASYLLDGWVSNPLLSNVQVMSTLPMTAMSQMRPKVDASAIKVHGKLRASVADASSSVAATSDVAPAAVSVDKLNQLDGSLLTLNAICILLSFCNCQ